MTENAIDAWFTALPTTQRPILDRLRSLIVEVNPNTVEHFKWSRPCYSAGNGLFGYLHTSKGHATLGFQNGAILSDPKMRLEGDGKDMRHIKLRTQDDFDEEYFRSLLIEAATL